ncbi:MAG: right-handed parallel beta-helix repeat-containing protein [Thermoplasmata archaeon]|nr:right-handed parallel beta-helix repeat-containing protein [Thermoplasmata archaeon]
MKFNMKFLFVLLLLVAGIFLLIIVANVSSADTITVAQDGSGNYEKIQDAIDASKDGDTIRVYGGTYFEHILIDKSINVIGNGSKVTTIDGGGERQDVVTITADWVNMTGFLVKEANLWNSDIIVDSTHVTLNDNECINAHSGILIFNCFYSTFTNNSCSDNQGGINMAGLSNHNTVMNNSCIENVQYGIRIDGSYRNTIKNNNFSNNSLSTILNGYGVYINRLSHNNTLTGNNITGNRVGIYLGDRSRDNKANYNNIYDNSEFGINALDNNGFIIDAKNNWWGNATGPYHPNTNPRGTGDEVTDFVDYDPWLNKPSKGGGGGFIPGFGAVAVVGAIGLAIKMKYVRRRGRT